jgi:hypothetical protein
MVIQGFQQNDLAKVDKARAKEKLGINKLAFSGNEDAPLQLNHDQKKKLRPHLIPWLVPAHSHGALKRVI